MVVAYFLPTMPRPKPPEQPRKFQVKIPPGEEAAIAEIVVAWGAALGAQGIHVVPTQTAWFRAVIREQAARYGVTIGPGGPADDSPPVAAPKPKRAR